MIILYFLYFIFLATVSIFISPAASINETLFPHHYQLSSTTELGRNFLWPSQLPSLLSPVSEWLNDNNLKDQLISSLYQMFLPLSVKLICNSDHLRSPTFMLVFLSRLKSVQDQISNVVSMMVQTLHKTKLGQVQVIVSFHKKNWIILEVDMRDGGGGEKTNNNIRWISYTGTVLAILA